MAGLLAALTATASAQTLFYGAAAGNWDNATANWGATSVGPFNTVWSNNNTANFSNQAAGITVTLSGAKTVNGITVGSGGAVTLSNLSVGGENLITFNSGAIIETNATLTIANRIAFANGFEKTGTGNLSFGNSTDVSTKINGTITVTAGMISATNITRFDSSTNLLMNGGNAGLNTMTLGGLSGQAGRLA